MRGLRGAGVHCRSPQAGFDLRRQIVCDEYAIHRNRQLIRTDHAHGIDRRRCQFGEQLPLHGIVNRFPSDQKMPVIGKPLQCPPLVVLSRHDCLGLFCEVELLGHHPRCDLPHSQLRCVPAQ